MGKWKAFQATKTAAIELYDLTKDPAESTDIAAQNPKVVQQIEQILAKSRTEATTPPTDPRIWEKYREDNKRLGMRSFPPERQTPPRPYRSLAGKTAIRN